MLSTQGSQFGQHNHNVIVTSSSGSVGSHRHKYAFAQGSNGGQRQQLWWIQESAAM